MKRLYIPLILLTLVLVLVLSGCNKKDDGNTPVVTPPVQNPTKDVGEVDGDSFMEELTNIIESNNEPDKIIAFIDVNLDKLAELDGDIMIDGLEKQLEKHLENTTDMIFDLDKENELLAIGNESFEFPEDKVSQIKNKELKAEVEKAYNNMYKLVNIEGQLYPIIDYSKLQKYNDYLTDEWKDYLNIMAMDSKSVPLVDGALRISFDELSNRLLVTENYLNSYVDGQRQKEVLALYENKIGVYLKGVPNTPIADFDSKIISPEVLASYEKTANVENYMTSHIVFKYLEFIKGNQNIIDEKVLEEADILIKEVMEVLTEFK